MPYAIEVTDDARDDIRYFRVFEQRIIVSAIRANLEHQPSIETNNRKRLRSNPLATWELRVGSFRVFYDVSDIARIVSVVAVGRKEHNQLFIKGKEVEP